MNKLYPVFSVAVLVGLMALPSAAKADTFISFGYNDGPSYTRVRYDDRDDNRGDRHHRRHHHRHHYREPQPIRYVYPPASYYPCAPVAYAPVYGRPAQVYYR